MMNILLFGVEHLFVCNRGDTYYSITEGSIKGSLAKPLSLVFLTSRGALSSHELELWSAHFDLETYTVLTHHYCLIRVL